MARFLSPIEYGILYTLISITQWWTIPDETTRSVMSKYTAKYVINDEYGKISYILRRATRRLLIMSIIAFFIFIPISVFMGKYLDINPLFIISTGSMLVLTSILPASWGVLQGLQRFWIVGFRVTLDMVLRFVFGIAFVLLGFGVAGAYSAIVAATLVVLVMSYYSLKDIWKIKPVKVETKEVYKYAWPILIGSVLLTIMFTIDVILVKRFFSPIVAGYYSAISTLAKVIFFAGTGLTRVMFPLVAERHEKGEWHKDLLYKSLIIVLIISIILIVIYTLFPNQVVSLLFGNKYLVDIILDNKLYIPLSHLVKYLAISMMFMSLTYTICFYNWSINKKRFIFLIILGTIAEIVLLLLSHRTIFQYIRVLIIVNIALFFMMLTTLIERKKYIQQNN